MSQSLNNDAPAAAITGKGINDIFDELSKGDDQETLSLDKPLDKKAGKEEKDEEPTIEDAPEGDEETGEEDDPLAEIEESLEEVDEEKLELTTPVARREILKKYPNLFKEFPYLEKAYYREQQFTEIVPTIDDAKQAVADQAILKTYVDDMVVGGNVNNVLKLIKDTNPETFAGVVDNYMSHLEKVDREAYGHVLGNITKNLILGMVQEATDSNNEDLKVAALLLNKFAFGTNKFTAPQKLAKEVKSGDSKESELSRREQEFVERQIQTVRTEVDTKVNNSIKAAIENNIDPTGAMTDYVKRNAIRDAQEKMSELISKDVRFKKITDKLWEKAASANFSDASKAELRKAFLAKAKSLLAPVLKSARNEALRGMGRKVKDEDIQEEVGDKPQRMKTERRLSSDPKAKLDNLKGKSSYEALTALMGD